MSLEILFKIDIQHIEIIHIKTTSNLIPFYSWVIFYFIYVQHI